VLLARQITGAVHDLFTGTQHLRNRDFVHTIPVRARDQLGELADSFNVMTGEVQKLLGEVVEKGRMEQEMHAAGEIQQKLLPPAPRNLVGLTLAAFCEPAREVAGDYYDFLPITDTMIGVLIADGRRQGAGGRPLHGAAQVIVQSLARLHHEPRDFLIAVNRVVAQNLDAKSFITMTYGVIDLERHEMTFARAGHCPLIHVPGATRPGSGTPTCSRRTAWSSVEHRRWPAVRVDAAGAHSLAGPRRSAGALHRRHQRDHERGLRLLRRGPAVEGCSSSTPTCRSISCGRISLPN
jgi:HAMP domain-containing protein